MTTLSTRKLSDNLGTEILDVDLAELSDATFEAIRTLWQHDPLLLLRRQSLTESELLAFSKRFGELDQNTIQDFHDEAIDEAHAPELLFISNLLFPDGSKVGGLSNSEVVWHTDLIYRARPASGTIFYGIEMPEGTGQTSYCNMAHAYRTLPEALRNRADSAQARCKLFTAAPLSMSMRPNMAKGYQLETKSDAGAQAIDERTPAVIQNLVVENAATGERSLYMSPNHTTALEGMCEQEARELFDALLEHALQPENIYCHQWRNGDVVLWDNVRLLHRRESFGDRTPRLAKRTTVYMDPDYFAVSSGETAEAV